MKRKYMSIISAILMLAMFATPVMAAPVTELMDIEGNLDGITDEGISGTDADTLLDDVIPVEEDISSQVTSPEDTNADNDVAIEPELSSDSMDADGCKNCNSDNLPIPVIDIKLNKTTLVMDAYTSVKLKATIIPAEATDKSIKWKATGNAIYVTEDGTVIACGDGESTITATAYNGRSATCKVIAKLPKADIERVENTEEGVKVTIKDIDVAMSYTVERSTDGKTYEPIGPCLGNGGGCKPEIWEPVLPIFLDKNVTKGTKYWYRAYYLTDWGSTSDPGESKSITYKSKVTEPTKVTLNKKKITATAGDYAKLAVKVYPAKAKSDYTIKSSNEKVVTISNTGIVQFVGAGKAKITVKTWNGKTASCSVTVKKPVAVTGIKLNKTSVKIKAGQKIKLHAEVLPSDAFDKYVFWDYDNDVVSMEGVVDDYVANHGERTNDIYIIGEKPGKAVVTAETFEGEFVAVCEVTVTSRPAKSVSLSKSKVTLKKGETVTLKAKVLPKKASQKVKWKSSDAKIAKVNSKGVVKALKKGTATITATTKNGKTASCKINVKK